MVLRRKNLSQRDAAVIRGHALMPIRLQLFGAQPADNPLGQIPVLKTAAAQRHARLAESAGDLHDRLGQRVVKLRRNFTNSNPAFHIKHDFADQRFPIHNAQRMPGDKRQLVKLGRGQTVEGELQFHRRLSFKPHLLAQVDN